MHLICSLLVLGALADAPGPKDPVAVARPMNVMVDWQVASEFQALRAQAAVPRRQAAVVQRALAQPEFVPVLLPDRTVLLESLAFHHGANHYTAAMRYRGVHIVVHATRRQFHARAPVVAGYQQPTLSTPEITRTHGIVTARFGAFGVGYDVDIECLGGEEHALCGSDAEVQKLVSSLARWAVRP